MKSGPAKKICAALSCTLLLSFLGACKSGKSPNVNAANTNSSAAEVPVPAGKNIDDIFMARDHNGQPGESGEIFGPDDRTIHSVAKLKAAPPSTKVRFSWWIVSAQGAENEKIRDLDYTTKQADEVVHSHLSLPNDWPPGKYKVDVYVNDNLDKTINFAVE